jgi:hypothetical protein
MRRLAVSKWWTQISDPKKDRPDRTAATPVVPEPMNGSRNNPWYFYREIAKAPARSGSTPDPVEFNRANIALWWSFYNHATFFLTQPRQTGKSFSTDLLMTHLMGFACLNTQINLLTKDDRLRSENIIRLKDIYEELPKWLQFKDPKTDSNNTEEITINALGNSS